MSSKQIIIPSGTIRPNETVVIDIPATYSQNSTILARDINRSQVAGPSSDNDVWRMNFTTESEESLMIPPEHCRQRNDLGPNRNRVALPRLNNVRRRLDYSTESEESLRQPPGLGRHRNKVSAPRLNNVRRRLNYSTESEESLRRARPMTPPRRAQSTDSLGLLNASQMDSTFASLGLMYPSQMQSSFGSGSFGIDPMRSNDGSQMASTMRNLNVTHVRPDPNVTQVRSPPFMPRYTSTPASLVYSDNSDFTFPLGSSQYNTSDFITSSPSSGMTTGDSGGRDIISPNPNLTRANPNATRNVNVTRTVNVTQVRENPNVTHVRPDPNVTQVRSPPFMPRYTSTPASLVYSDNSDFTFPLGSSQYNTSDFITSSPSSGMTTGDSGGRDIISPNPNLTRANPNATRNVNVTRTVNVTQVRGKPNVTRSVNVTQVRENPNVTHVRPDPNVTQVRSPPFMPRYTSTPVSLVCSDSSDFTFPLGSSQYNTSDFITSSPSSGMTTGNSSSLGLLRSSQMNSTFGSGSLRANILTSPNPLYTNVTHAGEDPNATVQRSSLFMPPYLSTPVDDGYGIGNSNASYVSNNSRYPYSSGYSADYSGSQLSPRNFADCSTANFSTDISSDFFPPYISTPQSRQNASNMSSPRRAHSTGSSGYRGDASSDYYWSSADESSRHGGSSRGYHADHSGSPSIFSRTQSSGGSSRFGGSSGGYSADYSGPQLSQGNFADCSTANFSTDISSDFFPPYISTPQNVRKSTFIRTKSPGGTTEEFTEEESFDDSSAYDTSDDENFSFGNVPGGRRNKPSQVVRKKLFKTIETPSGISELTIEETSEDEPSEEQFEEPSTMFDSSEERKNESMMGRVIAGDMGRRLIFPTPPGQPPGTGRVILLDGNEISSPDRKTVKFKTSSSGVKVFPGPSGAQSMNVTAPRSPTYDLSALMGENDMYDVSPLGSSAFESSQESTYHSNLFNQTGAYEDFAPGANSSEIDLRGNQTFNAPMANQANTTYIPANATYNPANATYNPVNATCNVPNATCNLANATYNPGSIGFLEELERNEQTQFDANLREWQSARRQLIFDTTKLSTSAAALHRHTR